MTHLSLPSKYKLTSDGRILISLTVLSAYFYTFMEWLFFVTKPSSLSMLTLIEKLKVFFITGSIVALLCLTGLAVLSLPAVLVTSPKWKVLRNIPLAAILTVTVLILFDNFTYTVFKFGVISTGGIFRGAYSLGVAVVFWRMIRITQRVNLKSWRPVSLLTLSLLTVSMAGILKIYLADNPYPNSDYATHNGDYPNIIILGGDGLGASYMSAYGYEQETTPFLTELEKTSIVAENAFTNASSTTASTTSVLTGKDPVRVNVLRYPDILSGNDSFEHLPGILKQQGYKTVEIGTSYYVDAQRLNLLDGFDIVNNHLINPPAIGLLGKILGNSQSMYFIQTILGRASERLLHIFYIKDIQNPVKEVSDPGSRITDAEKTAQIIQLVEDADRPLFIFAHYMDTHGPEFFSEYQVFSSGSDDNGQGWDVDFYKDAILSFDSHVEEIYEYLLQSGQLDNTILVIYTDHGYRYAVNQRIPIIIRFPADVQPDTRYNNVQVMDIPVTILDYLGIPAPQWMTGTSILNDEPPADREIISIVAGSPRKIAPPFYQIKIVQMIICEKWYALNVQDDTFDSGVVSGHTSGCNDEILPSDHESRRRILEYLENNGFDTSSLSSGN